MIAASRCNTPRNESGAFHLVIPSLPGYGFSGKPTAPGWTPVSIAKAWATLMQRLGYTRYVAQGGDWGNAVSEVMALQKPPGLLGIHTNMAAKVPVAVSAFPDEIYAAPKSWAEKAYPKLIYYNKLDKGGHFAAWEQPTLFSAEMRAAIKPLRSA